ncbi:carotenoid biosynthesis protein [Streptosporangium sp. NPDC006007]|uniref:carotenoid biosynthesis protein n=1 Tax=Streptosporangium sp. NPDC006007 TaxID=3154575 RepID=UPI0033AD7DA0
MGQSDEVSSGRAGLGAVRDALRGVMRNPAKGRSGDAPDRSVSDSVENTPDGAPDDPAGRPPDGMANSPAGSAPDGSTGGLRPWGALGSCLLVAVVVAQVMSGLQPRPILLTSVIVLLLAAGALAFAAGVHGLSRAVAAFAATVAVGYAAEWVGIRTGLPFGEYGYTDVLWPQLGGVPVIVAMAWGGMGLAAHATASAAAPGGRAARIVLGALALTAWDLFLDPQMMRLGLWSWEENGPYRGVPISNFVGWLVVSLLVMVLIDTFLADPAARSAGLVSVYTVMAVMETVGFAAVFDPPDPLVAVTGGICMGVFVVSAWGRWGPRGPGKPGGHERSRRPGEPWDVNEVGAGGADG